MKTCNVCGVNFNGEEIPGSDICYDCKRIKEAYEKGEHVPTEEEVQAELKILIAKFKEDNIYRRDILMRANRSILKNEYSLLDSLAEKKLIDIVIMSKY